MLNEITKLKRRLESIDNINKERLRVKMIKDNELNDLYNYRDKIREDIEVTRFIIRSSSEYYIGVRRDNLKELAQSVGDLMSNILDKEYVVEFDITRSGNYDYLERTINGADPKDLSGGEKQILSLAMVIECNSSGVIVLDETINSLDPITLEKAMHYLERVAEDKQIFITELDDNLPIPYTYIVENGTIKRGNVYV